MKTASPARNGWHGSAPLPPPMCLGLSALALCASQTLQAAVITLDDFSGNETVETFDAIDVSAGPVPLTILNGVTYTNLACVPPENCEPDPLFVSGGHSSRFDNIPGASLDPAGEDTVATSDFTIEFSTAVNRAGLLLSAGALTTWTLSAQDDNETELGAVEVSMPAANEAVFAGLEFPQHIARLQITEISDGGEGSTSVFDDLRYEAVIPIPAAVWLLASGLVLLAGVARRKPRP
jgi:hypothetical protein